jgi:Zn-dependent peptidase ImmA (M78 family)/transcriptional regulator with XRE-family HTH domain
MNTTSPQILGDQLRLARMALGLSLESVGEQVGASRQYIQQLETGAKSPSTEMVEALSDVLSVTQSFLSQSGALVAAEQCHFRKQLTTPASVTNQVLARGTIVERLVSAIERHLELPSVNFPQIAVQSVDDIESAAAAARRYWGLGSAGPIISMMRVVENAGAVVTNFGDLSDRVDALSMDRPRPIIVRSSAKLSLCRQRFDLAHECGHLIMHRAVLTGDRATEEQAHRFAGAFLVPAAAMLREFPRGARLNWRAIFEMKLRWKVSARALIRRAFDLKILTAAQYRSANIKLVRDGFTKYEPYDDQLPMEEPELLNTALDAISEGEPGGTWILADEVGVGEQMFELLTGRTLPAPPLDLSDPKVVELGKFRR